MGEGRPGMTDPAPIPTGEASLALAEALRRLESAERTVAELRTSLLKNHPPEAVEQALAWLSARKLLSDDRAAETTVRPRSVGRRAEGDARLRQRLESRGASPEAIEAALSAVPDEDQRMQEALAAKFRPDGGQRAKAGRFLLSRGFDEDSVESALNRFFEQDGEFG